ncbi:MAG: GGDEF domain-containing protein [Desulfobacteraceae bacterium]
MFNLIPQKNIQQQLRIRRFFMAAFSYLFFILLIMLCQSIGIFTLSLYETTVMISSVLLINLLFYLLFIFDINLYFKDKSLTMAQMTTAMIVIMVTIYYINNVRGAFLLLYVVSFSFGMFRLKIRQFLILTCLIIASYSAIIVLLSIYHPETIDIRLEMIRLLVLSVVFTWFSFLGGYINRLREKVEELATKDELTKLCNRRRLFEVLDREVELARRQYSPFTLLMVDIDNFKSINDTYGHLAGDQVLREVGAAMKKTIRTVDYVGRYGGEEFLVILSYPSLENAVVCANRIRQIIEDLSIEFSSHKISVTISTGSTVYCPEESLDTTLARADKALYMAKARGKNTVVALDCSKNELKKE